MGGATSTELRLLGGWELRVDGASVPLGSRQQRLLAALAIFGRRSRSFLGGLLWPECTEAHAMGSLRAAVFTVSRRAPGLLGRCGHDLCLDDAVAVDLHRLRRALVSAVPSGPATGSWWAAGPCSADLLPGWYDDWVTVEQQRLREQVVNAAELRAASALRRADPHEALLLAQTARDLDPLRESTVRLLVEAHLALGNHGSAAQAFRQYAASLAEEIGARPSPQFARLLVPVRAG